MILNYEEIKSLKLIQNYDDSNFDNGTYDLRIQKLITVNGKLKTSLAIEPNIMTVAMSKETVKLPNNVIGHAFVKTRLSRKGIMANNIGVIDPGYEGPLSSVLVNFGKNAFELKEDDIFLRLTFTKFQEPQNNIDLKYGPFDRKEYESNTRSTTMEYLGNAFVDIEENIGKKVNSRLGKMITSFGLWATAFGLVFAGVTFLLSIKDNDSTKIKNLEEQIHLFNSNQIQLLNGLEESKQKIDSLNLLIQQSKRNIKIESDGNVKSK